MKRDSLFANYVLKETKKLNLNSFTINGDLDWNDYFDRVENQLMK